MSNKFRNDFNVPFSYVAMKPPEQKKKGLLDTFLLDKKERVKEEIANDSKKKRPFSSYDKNVIYFDANNVYSFYTKNHNSYSRKNNNLNVSKNQKLHELLINQNLINNLNQEIEQYKETDNKYNNYKAKPKKKPKPYAYSGEQIDVNLERDEIISTILTATQQFRKKNLEVYAPENVNRRKFKTSQIPYSIKCFNKKKVNSIYFQPCVDSNYNQRYRKQKINIEDVLLFHNTNERKEMGMFKLPDYIYNRNEYFLKENYIQKALKKDADLKVGKTDLHQENSRSYY